MDTGVASIVARVSGDMSRFRHWMSEFSASVGRWGGVVKNFVGGIVQGIGQAFGFAAIRAVRDFGDAIAGTLIKAAEMEQAIADIAAIMGLTAEETSKVEKLVSDLGIDPKLKVTAVEAASAVEMLAKNGVALDQILSGAARSSILLANSTGADFSMAADIATDAMVQFGLKAEDMTKAVDGITGVTRNSKLDINDYRLAIGQAGGVAGSVGVTFEDFNAILAASAHVFSGGSDAGTSFKTFLQALVPSTNKAADAMRSLGLFSGLTADEFAATEEKIQKKLKALQELDKGSKNYTEKAMKLNAEIRVLRDELKEGAAAFFDQNGNMLDAATVAEKLKEAFGHLSDAQRIEAAQTIFGRDAMRTAFALMDAGSETINKLKAAIGDTSAEESAAIRMNTLAGAWEIFSGIVESLSIQFGKSFIPAARQVVETLIDLATHVGPMITEWGQKLGEKVSAVTTALTELIRVGMDEGWRAIFTPFQDGTRHLDKLFEAFGFTKNEAKRASQQFIDTATTIVNLATVIGSLIVQTTNAVLKVADWIDQLVGLEFAFKAVGLVMVGSFIASIVSAIGTIASMVGSIITFVSSLTGLGAIASTVSGVVMAAISAIGGPITLIVAAIGALALAWSQNWFDIQGK